MIPGEATSLNPQEGQTFTSFSVISPQSNMSTAGPGSLIGQGGNILTAVPAGEATSPLEGQTFTMIENVFPEVDNSNAGAGTISQPSSQEVVLNTCSATVGNITELDGASFIFANDGINSNEWLCRIEQRLDNFENVLTGLVTAVSGVTASVSSLKVVIEAGLHKLKRQSVPSEDCSSNDIATRTDTNFSFPLMSSLQLDELEQNINGGESFRKNIIEHLCSLHGTSGKKVAKHVFYGIIDYMFKRELMTVYSWSGVSKGKL